MSREKRHLFPVCWASTVQKVSGVYWVSASDRFGDHGIIGVLILRFEESTTLIDSFLLSCRVIGRGIENAVVAFAADVARRKGAEVLHGEFIPTAKNAPVSTFYEDVGFRRLDEATFEIDLSENSLQYPDYVLLEMPDPVGHGPGE